MDSQKATSTFSVAKVRKISFSFFILHPFFFSCLQLFYCTVFLLSVFIVRKMGGAPLISIMTEEVGTLP